MNMETHMAAPGNPEQCADMLARSLKAQADVCRRILEKTKKQQKMVEEHLESELLSLLGDKQKLIDEHQVLTARSAEARELWENGYRDRASPQAHAKVEAAWNDLRNVLDEIVKLEDVSRATLEEQKNRVSIDIGNLQRGKIVNKAYGGAQTYRPPTPPRYSDKKG